MIKEKRNILTIVAVVVYLLSAGASYAVCNFWGEGAQVISPLPQDEGSGGRLVLDTVDHAIKNVL